MELSAQLELRRAELFLEWVPRSENKEADRLAYGRFDGFDPALRVTADLSQVRWLVMDELLAAGQEFYEQLNTQPAQGRRLRGSGGSRAHKRAKLRERDPW